MKYIDEELEFDRVVEEERGRKDSRGEKGCIKICINDFIFVNYKYIKEVEKNIEL